MNLQEVCKILGKSENTILHAFNRTQNNLLKHGIKLTRTGRFPNIEYNIEYIELNPNTYIIYKHTNKINGKVYIGQSKYSLEERSKKNGEGYKTQKKFWNAIQKYGWNNFTHEVLFSNLSKEEANKIEITLIEEYDSIKNGYNVRKGGSNFNYNESSYQNSNSNFLGKKHTEEYKIYMSNLMKEKWNNNNYKEKTKENMKKNHANCNGKNNSQSKEVYCIEKNISAFSCGEMAKKLNFDPVQGGKSIARVARGERKTYKNLHFIWANEKNEEKISEIIKEHTKGIAKKVKCIETNKIYNSIKEASRDTLADASSISKCCNGIQKTAKKLHWEWVKGE